jgi:hypothetical protein
MVLGTPKKHFDHDMLRAQSLYDLAVTVSATELKADLFRASWMLSVGALDAFFCDAYADILSRTLRAKENQSTINMPDRLGELKVPVIAILEARGGWRWRMAARELIEKENVLSLDKIKKLLNLFCRDKHKLLTEETIEQWIIHDDATQRLMSVSRNTYKNMSPTDKQKYKKSALASLDKRMRMIFQRRHDCIHNCDRPKTGLTPIQDAQSQKVICDINFLVSRCFDHMVLEFPQYLHSIGCNGATRNSVGV